MMKTLFLHPPSYDGFDGGAGSRYQARREIRSFWYPTWLAQSAALVPGSKLIDAPPHRIRIGEIVEQANRYDLAVLHTSTPSFASDLAAIEALKRANPRLKAGMIGAKVAVDPVGSLEASAVLDFVARNEFDFTIKEVAEGRDWQSIRGLSYRNGQGVARPVRALRSSRSRKGRSPSGEAPAPRRNSTAPSPEGAGAVRSTSPPAGVRRSSRSLRAAPRGLPGRSATRRTGQPPADRSRVLVEGLSEACARNRTHAPGRRHAAPFQRGLLPALAQGPGGDHR